jgi:hypothetical protein
MAIEHGRNERAGWADLETLVSCVLQREYGESGRDPLAA